MEFMLDEATIYISEAVTPSGLNQTIFKRNIVLSVMLELKDSEDHMVKFPLFFR